MMNKYAEFLAHKINDQKKEASLGFGNKMLAKLRAKMLGPRGLKITQKGKDYRDMATAIDSSATKIHHYADDLSAVLGNALDSGGRKPGFLGRLFGAKQGVQGGALNVQKQVGNLEQATAPGKTLKDRLPALRALFESKM